MHTRHRTRIAALLRVISLSVFFLAVFLLAACRAAGQAPPYKPRELKGVENYLQAPFLQPGREWERLDVYVPGGTPGGAKLPCVVLFYGGGWGSKNMGGVAEEIEPLVGRGYVVAVADYLLSRDPVPQAVWDGASAVRFLRAHAADYRIDPERVGVWGFSAGGWLVQMMGAADAASATPKRAKGEKGPPPVVPTLAPHPQYPGQSNRVQAIVTDWGAGRVAPYATADDPPLLTYANPGEAPAGPAALLAAGVPCEVARIPGNTHVPSTTRTLTTDKAGAEVTLRRRVHQFLDEYVKEPKEATAPEFLPHGGPHAGPAGLTIRSVHPLARVYYTTDGSDPTPASPAYEKPLTVEPGATVKAIAVKPGLSPSRVTTASFTKGTCAPPVIVADRLAFAGKKGEAFATTFAAESKLPVRWLAVGKLGGVGENKQWSPDWLRMDPRTGALEGTPPQSGVYTFIVAANAKDGDHVLVDARTVILTVAD